MPLQNGAYLALSRKFCRQVNIVKIFSLVRQTRNTRAGPDAMAKVVGTVGGSKAQPSECLKRAYTGNEPASLPLGPCKQRRWQVRAIAQYRICL